ncbi:unnamed protein product [Caenorhabditis nigoni]
MHDLCNPRENKAVLESNWNDYEGKKLELAELYQFIDSAIYFVMRVLHSEPRLQPDKNRRDDTKEIFDRNSSTRDNCKKMGNHRSDPQLIRNSALTSKSQLP